MSPIRAVLLCALLLAGCGGTRSAEMPTTLAGPLGVRTARPAARPDAPTMAWAQAASQPGASGAVPPKPIGPQLCDAPSLAYLVGHSRADIPVPADLSKRRVSCTTCPGADDQQPDRTDILFNAQTGVIVSVSCG